MDGNKKIRVFLSYTHDSEDHKQIVLDFANKLNYEGLDCWCDRYVEGSSPDKGWPAWMEENIRIADYVLVICTETYLRRYEGREEKGKGLGAIFESVLMTQHIYNNSFVNKKVIPVLLSRDDRTFIPKPLEPFTHYLLYDDYEVLYRRITNQIKIIKPPVGNIKIYPSRNNSSKDDTSDELTTISSHIQVEEAKNESELPEIPEITATMKSGLKIVQAFYTLPITQRFSIAAKLGLLEDGESYMSEDRDKISSKILLRAKSRGVMANLWSELFDEKIEPNPFK